MRKYRFIIKTAVYPALFCLFFSCEKYDEYDTATALPPLPLIETKNNVTLLPLGSDPRYNFYAKYINAYEDDYLQGIPIISTYNVADNALKNVRKTITEMLALRGDIRKSMALNGSIFIIMQTNEKVSDHIVLSERPDQTAYAYESDICYGENSTYSGHDASIGACAKLIFLTGIFQGDSLLYNTLLNLADSAESQGIFHPDQTLTAKEKAESYFVIISEVWFGKWKGYQNANNGLYDIVSRTLMMTNDAKAYDLLKGIYKEEDWNPCH